MTWLDLRAFVLNLPATSAVRRHINPAAARTAEWHTPTNQLLGRLYDQQLMLALAKQQAPLPENYRPVVHELLDAELEAMGGSSQGNAEQESGVVRSPKPRALTPAEIRAKVTAMTNR
ncbi:hypothetical protein [Corynebacterium urealyticum]|uniref:hypothetical protein n=1 Tax=Corynebacterium urealyticum TaxID=43771 RepID=UPI0011E7678A|nr:hypothetical protein [Corynebacterium urealyticum]TYR15630.1 hypothetical protein FYJ89_03635 [Corynebacterium urealyticum]TYR17966.1 hypothetical protein FYJ88_03835 [Corynebacterium urealyticum]